jgi:hypothetical protein
MVFTAFRRGLFPSPRRLKNVQNKMPSTRTFARSVKNDPEKVDRHKRGVTRQIAGEESKFDFFWSIADK